MTIKKVLVTGSDGRIGRAIVKDLQAHGYEVTPADKFPREKWRTKIVDFEDLGQVVGIMHGHDAVIHMAAIPTPTVHTAEVVFQNNVMTTFNVLEAATILGIKNVVLASSVSALGFAYRHRPFSPVEIPINESHPMLSQDCYGLSKMVGEELAEGYLRRIPDMSIASMRFTLVADEPIYELLKLRREQPDAQAPDGAFWTFVDVRDAASSCRLAMEYDQPGHEAFYINAPIIYRKEPVEELLANHYADTVPVADHIKGNISPVDTSKAEKLLGWNAKYTWDGSEL